MALYSLHSGFISRSTGRSSVQSVAYITGTKMYEERRSKSINYTKKSSEVVLVKTIQPHNSVYAESTLWNAVENFEDQYAELRYKNIQAKEQYICSAQTAMTIVVALPNEFSHDTNEELLDKFVNIRFLNRKLCVTYAIHSKDNNPHAHIQVTRRAIGEDGFFQFTKDREICTRKSLIDTRKLWADLTNEFLEREGVRDRVTEKSFVDLGINLEATHHVGAYANKMLNRSRIVQENRKIQAENSNKIIETPEIILDYLNITKAAFSQRDILNEIIRRITNHEDVATVFEQVLNSALFVGEGINGEQLYTGEKYSKLESDTLSLFETILSKKHDVLCNTTLELQHLNEEQQNAVKKVCNDDKVSILVGRAGAGKTTTMKAVSDIYKRAGCNVVGMSISAVASENLGDDAQITSRTIASWIHVWDAYENAEKEFLKLDSIKSNGILHQFKLYKDLTLYEKFQLRKGDVIIVDEAGMVGTSDWMKILRAADKFGAKIIAVGDDNQFKPISAGDCFREFLDICRCNRIGNISFLNNILRQKDEWMKQSSVELSKLNIKKALAMYEANNKVICSKDTSLDASKKYLDYESHGSSVVLCSTKKMCAEINQLIRLEKKKNGSLGQYDFTYIQNRGFAENDKVMFMENNSDIGVKNGQVGIVIGGDKDRLVIKTGNVTKFIDIATYDKIDHAYAMTLHKSQGKTFDNVVVIASKHVDAKACYVAMTRHRYDVTMLYSKSDFHSFKKLTHSLSKYSYKDTLHDFKLSGNENKVRVAEYKSTLFDLITILKEVKSGEASWNEYSQTKSYMIEVGKRILSDYNSHELYLRQAGLTKEQLEIDCGITRKPLSKAHINAKQNIKLYSEANDFVKSIVSNMRISSRDITKSNVYEVYKEAVNIRNYYGFQILSNYPLHRQFVNNELISKQSLERQILGRYKCAFTDKTLSEIINVTPSGIIGTYKGKTIREYCESDNISKSMVYAYCGEFGIKCIQHNLEFIRQYADELFQSKFHSNKCLGKEKLINDSIRQAICFKALQTFEQLNYKGRYSIDDISFSKLHTMSTVLSSNIKDEQAYILNSFNTVKQLSEMMKIEKCEKTQLNNGTIQELISTNIKEMSNMSYKEPIKETSKDFEIGL